ncbi:MAG: amidinotransferase [Crocinitomicaceae bacterium]|nr:amidinotransferase [Crocinitomicaceae bacterium]
MQNPNKLVLLAPKCFQFNEQTANNNFFQKNNTGTNQIALKAALEHAKMVAALQKAGIETCVLADDEQLNNPDAIFLNNWFSITPNKTLVIYPMWAENRRREIRATAIEAIKNSFKISKVIDFSDKAAKGLFCEGTGSIIFDHLTRKAYACISPRTNVVLFEQICQQLNYQAISFLAEDALGRAVYHTNVMLSIGKNIIVVCSASITNPIERKMLLEQLRQTDRLIVDISFTQMNQFCGNVFEVTNQNEEDLLLMSESAFQAFEPEQIASISERVKIAFFSIPTIETYGGGSVRCTIAGGFI